MNFQDLGLSEQTIKAIDEYGITTPTTVQADVIPAILEGRDIFTIAPARCGKTMSYVLPLLDIINSKKAKNILIITANSQMAVKTSDCLAVFNKYHEINSAALHEGEEQVADEANVIIGAPDLLLDVADGAKVDISQVDILVVDDINLIKKNKQLDNLEKVLDMLPAQKQNVVYTNRRSKETQTILSKILKTPAEIKIDKDKEQEVDASSATPKSAGKDKKTKPCFVDVPDQEAIDLAAKHNSFNGRTPRFILVKGIVAEGEEKN
ncbi:MAG: DEAD/DEAH box helicase [Alphaproteobacteria bacterium]|nr:DEAD/DEAH box helicase [Alphaproteobacteria bacterium]